MPELPEVEVVRRGLAEHVVGRRVSEVAVLHPRAVRRHLPGAHDLVARLTGRTLTAARRRGKYLWLETDSSDAVLAHLGMSGQLLVSDRESAAQKHLRAWLAFADAGPELRFVDQRTFGGLSVEPMHGDPDRLPARIAHIARDPMDPGFDLDVAVSAIRRRRTELKRALLDQTLVSGIGNIYADEALWRARLHGARSTATLSRAAVRGVLSAASEVMTEALAEGGTSFDALYVNVNGNSGYFDRSLNVYGQAERPCPRCGSPIRREPFMNRSSYSCPTCQPRPRGAAARG
ncbi:MAG: bifunctional DNA-formamidopyrimidine glycosylase/DNA-(apurinic or apyrimidinic site) lyase [Pseudonocardia sp.]